MLNCLIFKDNIKVFYVDNRKEHLIVLPGENIQFNGIEFCRLDCRKLKVSYSQWKNRWAI